MPITDPYQTLFFILLIVLDPEDMAPFSIMSLQLEEGGSGQEPHWSP